MTAVVVITGTDRGGAMRNVRGWAAVWLWLGTACVVAVAINLLVVFDLWDELVPTLGVIGVVVGAALANWGQRTNEQRKWLRETRMRVYAEYLEAVTRLATAENDQEGFAAYRDIGKAQAEIKLISRDPTAQAAAALGENLRLGPGNPTWHEIENMFLNAAREELGMPKLESLTRA